MKIILCIFFGLFMLLSSSHGLKFHVGGKDGWVLNPSENYNHWAERNRFQVNDTLSFKLKQENDSVLQVTRENYNQCNTKNPIKSLTESESKFMFERSGPHYFISGNEDYCNRGQKLIIVVLAIRPKKQTTPSAPTPAPVVSPPPSGSPPPSAHHSSVPASSPPASDAPPSSTKHNKSSALGVSTMIPSAVISAAIGVVMFLGCFGWMV